MKTVGELLPLAVALAVVAVVTWFLLTRGWGVGPWVLALLLFAHGWVHVMFLFPQPESATAAGGATWPFDMNTSWLIRAGLDGALVRLVGTGLIVVVLAGFLVAALATAGVLVPGAWWAPALVGSAVGSALLLVLFFSPTLLLGFAIDAGLVWLVAASIWSPGGSATA